jgi:hypothetical protein
MSARSSSSSRSRRIGPTPNIAPSWNVAPRRQHRVEGALKINGARLEPLLRLDADEIIE